MKLSEVVRDLAFLNPGWRLADIHQRARLLREAGYLPQGGRGRAAPDLWNRDIATLLVGICAAERAVDIVSATSLYVELEPPADSPIGPQVAFGDRLAMLLSDEAVLETVEEVVVVRSWPEAWITYRVPRKQKKGTKAVSEQFLPRDGRPRRRDGVEIRAVVGPDLLRHFARQISEAGVSPA